jgi:hypothetical protein
MDILARIASLLDLARGDEDLKRDDVVDVLSEVYGAVSDGLQRSQAAGRLPGALHELESVRAEAIELREDRERDRAELANLREYREATAKIVEEMRSQVIAWYALRDGVSREQCERYAARMRDAGPHEIAQAYADLRVELSRRYGVETNSRAVRGVAYRVAEYQTGGK